MKSILIHITILFTALTSSADVTKQNFQDAEVTVFDATCIPVSAIEGTLNVNMRVRKSEDVQTSGVFYSYNDVHHDTDQWSQIPLAQCQQVAAKLIVQAGRKLM